jgi:hypothetical protein
MVHLARLIGSRLLGELADEIEPLSHPSPAPGHTMKTPERRVT